MAARPAAGAEPAFVTVRFVVERLPEATPTGDTLVLATNAERWDPAAPGCAFTRLGARHELLLRLPRGTLLEYKLTRGSWETVETLRDGRPRENRTFDALADASVRIAVERWADAPGPRPAPRSTLTGTVETLHAVLSPELGNRREVWVALPPDYARSDRRYPVLYLHDGQNAFDASTAFVHQEWRADEAAQASARAGRPLIVVAVGVGEPSAETPERLSEYAPWPMESLHSSGLGPRYASFLARTLKPRIDARYRTLPGREDTGLAGASMGGLISLYAALEHPDVFGFAGVLSPSLWWAEGAVFPWLESHALTARLRIYLDTGDREGASLDEAEQGVLRAAALARLLRAQGHELRFRVAPGGRHNENAWAQRFPQVLRFFLEGRPRESG